MERRKSRRIKPTSSEVNDSFLIYELASSNFIYEIPFVLPVCAECFS